MKELASRVGFSELEYMDLPKNGTRAYRDLRRSSLPPCNQSFHPNWKVRFVFDRVTFTTNVEADDEATAKSRAITNLKYTYYPSHCLKALGKVRSIICSRIRQW